MDNFLNLQRIIKPLDEKEVDNLFEALEKEIEMNLETYPIDGIENFYVNILKKNEK